MMVLITYDVADENNCSKRLRRVAKACKDWGQRVQFSVFECIVDPAQWVALKDQLLKEIDPKTDSLRFYFMGSSWKHRVEHHGIRTSFDQEGPLIV